MFKKDIDLILELNKKYNFQAPLLDAGGLENPTVADYEISINKAIPIELRDGQSNTWKMNVPHPDQGDRYVDITRPWDFIDPEYVILNPEYGDPPIEELPKQYSNSFSTVILVSVFEHVNNPYVVSDALYRLIRPGGFLINSTPFMFPFHPSPEEALCLQR